MIKANYNDPDALKQLLEAHKVEIVISAIIIYSEGSSKAQLNLIQAASESSTVKKFIPSEYGVKYTPECVNSRVYPPALTRICRILAFHPAAQWWLDAAAALRNTRMQFTRIVFGWVLDHYGMPHVKSNMKPVKYALDFDSHQAAIPGDGETPITLLHSVDLAKYIAAMLEQENWPEVSAFVGDRMSWGEMVRVAERVTGK